MAKGAQAKEIVTQKILEVFPGAFINEKEIRIPMNEAGEIVQLKVTLTCAKVNVDPPSGDFTSTATSASIQSASPAFSEADEMTKEEKEKVADLLSKLNIEV